METKVTSRWGRGVFNRMEVFGDLDLDKAVLAAAGARANWRALRGGRGDRLESVP